MDKYAYEYYKVIPIKFEGRVGYIFAGKERESESKFLLEKNSMKYNQKLISNFYTASILTGNIEIIIC